MNPARSISIEHWRIAGVNANCSTRLSARLSNDRSWLDKYERWPGEAAPIGLILRAEAGIEQVELLNMPKDNILIAEYWTDLPPKELLKKKLHDAFIEVRERLEERRFLTVHERSYRSNRGP